jgi:hypothetical protein
MKCSIYRYLVTRISPVRFHLSRVGNDNNDIPFEEHFENSETRKGSRLYQELPIFVQIYEFYLS